MLYKTVKYHLDHHNLDHNQVYLVCMLVLLAIIRFLRIESHNLHLLLRYNNEVKKNQVESFLFRYFVRKNYKLTDKKNNCRCIVQ